MKILITGSAGFIGFHLSQHLLKNGHHIYWIDNFQNERKISSIRNRILKKFKKYFFLKIDLSKKTLFYKKIKFDLIIHLAAIPGVRISMNNPIKCINSNIQGFQNILEYARKKKIKNIFFASSSTVYGEEKKNFEEKKLTRFPKSIYAMTKISNELMANLYHKEYGINFVGFRFFSIYGKYGRPDMSYFKFLTDIKRNKKIYLNGNGNIKRSFTHIDDAIIALTRIISKYKNLKSFNEIYNIGNNKSVKISNIINIIKKNYKKKFKVIRQKGFSVDSQITKSSNLKIYNSIKFEPKVNIEKGLKEFINWFEKY